MPAIAKTALPPFQIPSIARTELSAPSAYRFVRDDDSTLRKKILDIAEAHAEAVVQPDRVANDLQQGTDTHDNEPHRASCP
jgi:hypothetical protein